MKTLKAEAVASSSLVNNKRVWGLATNLEGRSDYPHFISNDDLKGDTHQAKRECYIKLITKNHPEYVFIPEDEEIVIMTPPTEAVHPYKEELETAFGVDEVSFTDKEEHPSNFINTLKEAFKERREEVFMSDMKERYSKYNGPETFEEFVQTEREFYDSLKQQSVPDNVDQETGEIFEESPQVNNNPLKTETMENQTEQATEPKVEQVKSKVSLKRKAKWYGAVGLGVGVRTVTVPTHFALQASADLLQLAADGVRNTEAFAIDKLKLSTATRNDIKLGIERRTRRIENIVVMPITLPISITKGIATSIQAARASRGTVVEPIPTA